MMTKVETHGTRRWTGWRRRMLWGLAAGLILMPFLALYVMAATDRDDNIVIGRNEVVQAPGGGRVWRGTFWNHSDSVYTRLDAVVLLLDREGRPVAQARGGAARLDPGETFDLSAPLPPEAAQMQVYQLRWTNDGGSAVLGPWRAWPFGRVQDEGCGPIRLAIGSCTPMRTRDGA